MTLVNVRRRLDETVALFWSDDELTDWLTEGAAEVARRTETLATLATFDIAAGDSSLTLPADLLRVHVVLLGALTPDYVRFLVYTPLHSFTPHASPREPWCYTVWNRELSFNCPCPRATVCYVAYYKTGTDIPAGREDLLVDYCEFRALRKDRDPRWHEAKALFDAKLSQMIDTTRSWTDDLSRMMDEGGEFYFAPGTVVPVTAGWDASLWDEGLWDEPTS